MSISEYYGIMEQDQADSVVLQAPAELQVTANPKYFPLCGEHWPEPEKADSHLEAWQGQYQDQ